MQLMNHFRAPIMLMLTAAAAAGAMAMLAGCGGEASTTATATATESTLSGDRVYRIEVPDMVCASCAATLRRALEKVEGVEGLQIHLEEKAFDVGVDAALHPADEKLRQAIVAAGFLKEEDN